MGLDSQSTSIDRTVTNIDAAKLGLEPKEVSVLFSDIYGYRKLTRNLESTEVAYLLNEYFQSMVDAVYKSKNNFDKQIELACIRNSLIVVFGAPEYLDNHPWIALQTAVEMTQQLSEFNTRLQGEKKPTIKMGIGINSGTILSDQIGSGRRMAFTAIGDSVSLGYYLEGISKQYGCEIVLSESAYRACAEKIWVRDLDLVRMRNDYTPVPIYEFLGWRSDPISEQKQQVIEHYDKGRKYYMNRQFPIALGEFATVLEIDHNDKPSALHLKRCQKLLKEPPADDWDGVTDLAE